MTQNTAACLPKRCRSAGVLFCLSLSASVANSSGQVVLDGKFGTSGAVNGPAFDITSDLGAIRGNNLFHSFQQFDLKAGDGATISVVGGDVTMQGGFLRSASGNINVVSVKSAGEAPANPNDLSSADFRTVFPNQGQITLTEDARIDASGEAGGRIVIRGGNL